MHLACDGKGRPLAVLVTPGQRHDSICARPLLERIRVLRPVPGRPRCRPEQVIADKAYSSRGFRAYLRKRVLVRGVVAGRIAWEEASVPRDAAAARIGWHRRDIVRMGEEGRITLGKGGRYLIADLEALAAEADGEQYITAQTAAEDVLEIRYPADWKYVEAAGWVRPVDTYEREVGRHRTVTVALYRLADVRAVRDMPGVDWEAVRGLPKGAVSPLREYAALAPPGLPW
ncbi:transposase [Streptomyces sp. NPDC008196]|uniref:transposase n=1 Tax=Streptomyces sp. NPDC008196 TaxID=3364819 RepID=UPI0036ED1833